jgi:hypothetical protein
VLDDGLYRYVVVVVRVDALVVSASAHCENVLECVVWIAIVVLVALVGSALVVSASTH